MSYLAVAQDVDGHAGRPSSSSSSTRSRSHHGLRGKQGGTVGQASWISSVINLVNTIVGAGVLAMPLAMSHMGIVLGTLVIVWSGLMSGFGLYLQTRCARYLDRGSSSFFALSQITYPNAAVVFDAAIAIKCFGVGVSYLIIIGDLMPGVARGLGQSAGDWPFLVDRRFWITAFMLIVIPLSFLRRLDSLKYTSVIALLSIGYLVILVVYHFGKGDTMQDRGEIRVGSWAGIVPALSSLPVVVFGYTCHQNMFSILNEINDNSRFRTGSVVVASIGSACSIYVLVAITGYLSFGNGVADNIVGMYTPSRASTLAKAAIVVLVMFSYPLQAHPCRASIDAVLRWRPKRLPDPATVAPHHHHHHHHRAHGEGMGDVRFAAITTAIIVASYAVAMTVTSLSTVLAYVGSTGSTSISFILPGLFYHKMSSPESALHQRMMKEDDDGEGDDGDGGEVAGLLGGGARGAGGGGGWRRGLLRRASLALAGYGAAVMVTCLVTTTVFNASPPPSH